MSQETHLVLSLVTHQHYERSVVLLDIVIDEDGYPWVELFPHRVVIFKTSHRTETGQKEWIMNSNWL